ncbi:MAG: oligosaccharide flippase family protein, partial [Burkholderiaceae bacterium]|nr:oligosaccharide flippase family protein [Burkholderiaceae bacterium]
SLSAVPGVLLSRVLRFRALFWMGLSTIVVRSVVAVGCAAMGLGMWSLVIGSLASTAADVLLHFVWAPYWPRRRFHWPVIARTWRTSTGYLGNTALYYMSMNLDLLLIGRHLGAAPLGFYQNARSLTDEIRGRIAMPIQHVLFPAFSALQDDRARFQQLVLRAGRLVAAVVVPVGFGVSANAQELVAVLYGAQWQPMAPVMAMFGLSAALRAGTAIGSPLFNANDRVGLAFRYNAVGAVLTLGGVLVAMPHGIEAVAGAVALASLYGLVSLRAALRLIGLGWGHVAQMLGAPMAAAAVMWGVIEGLRSLAWTHSPATMLLAHVAAGGAVYLALLLAIAPQYGRDARGVLRLLLNRS